MAKENEIVKLRVLENFHILLWLVKDLCWCMQWRQIGIIMIIPTLIFAFFITYKSRKQQSELFHNMAVIMWILANSTWMLGEFYYHDRFRNIALLFFILGLLIVTVYYLKSVLLIGRKTK
jgi:ABC-type xylose transport system permease subunit